MNGIKLFFTIAAGLLCFAACAGSTDNAKITDGSDDTVEIGWISLKGNALKPIEKQFLQILKKHIEEGLIR